jgi:hypothetical protein
MPATEEDVVRLRAAYEDRVTSPERDECVSLCNEILSGPPPTRPLPAPSGSTPQLH